ncbi:MAG: ATP-dependent 6-phosphofructokinase [Eubacteriales bacterium]|nr:ATP-dependent 6-phosphofructokinase [Eubacteriales bacterium]
MKKIAILTSGGDAPGMNAAIRAAVRCGIDRGMEVYGIDRGYEGLLDGDIRQMDWHSVGDILQRGGTILRTARSSRFMEDKWIEHGAMILDTFGIEGLVVVGGDGSLSGGLKLSKYGIPVMGIPGTIDNDLAYTEYTIGFDTAVNTVLGLISNIRDTSSSHERTTIIEVMGRNCGALAIHAGLAGGADVILVPEVKVDTNEICRKVLEGQATGKAHSLIVMAEGADFEPEALAGILEKMTGREARTVVPGYIQRGGSPTLADRRLASLTAAKAVELLYDDSDSKAIGMDSGKIIAMDLADALKIKPEFDMELYELANVLGKGK